MLTITVSPEQAQTLKEVVSKEHGFYEDDLYRATKIMMRPNDHPFVIQRREKVQELQDLLDAISAASV